MRISRFFIDRPIFASVLSIIFIILGGVSFIRLPIAQYPEIAPPIINVSGQYPGANAEVVATTVVAPIEDGFAIGGVNSSDQDLSQVQATLKPDGGGREIALALRVEGRAASNAVIPAGARFSFGSDATDDAKPSTGAILTFRYVIAGQQKAAIVYLSAATIARFASRE